MITSSMAISGSRAGAAHPQRQGHPAHRADRSLTRNGTRATPWCWCPWTPARRDHRPAAQGLRLRRSREPLRSAARERPRAAVRTASAMRGQGVHDRSGAAPRPGPPASLHAVDRCCRARAVASMRASARNHAQPLASALPSRVWCASRSPGRASRSSRPGCCARRPRGCSIPREVLGRASRYRRSRWSPRMSRRR